MTVLSIVLVFAAVIAGCVVYIWQSGRLGVREARARVRRGALLLDVDSVDEYQRAHLAGAVNVPVEDIEERRGEIGPPSRSVVVYAREELRSAHAASVLRALGYRTVLSLGAMDRW